MAKIIGLPKLSPTMEEGTLVAWMKKEGDEVDVDDLLAEVETDEGIVGYGQINRTPVKEMAAMPFSAAASITRMAVSRSSDCRANLFCTRMSHCGQRALQRSVYWTTT